MKRRKWRQIILIAMAAAMLLGCGWDSTPKLYIPTPPPTEVPVTRRPGETEPPRTLAPDETPSPSPTPTPDPDATPDPNATPTPQPTIDPNLVGLWSYAYSTYKGATSTAKETGHTIDIRFFADGSAATEFDGESTTGLKFSIDGATVTVTVYGITWLTLLYDGTHLIWEQQVNGDYVDSIFERKND